MSELRYLLDTNVLSDMLRRPSGVARTKAVAVGETTICTSVIVACELQYGVAKGGSQRLEKRLRELFVEIPVLALDTEVQGHYGRLRAALESAGTPIGPNDLVIAAHALSLDLTLVTHNTGEFGRVPGLKVEDWLG